MNSDTVKQPGLHWQDLPLVLMMSLFQAAAAGVLVGMVTGGLVGWIGWHQFWFGTLVVAPFAGIFFLAVFVMAGLLPETKMEELLAIPQAD